MSWWVAGAAVVGAIGGAVIGGNATEDAANTQAAATAGATAEQQRQYDLTRADQAPYREQGQWALGQLHDGLGRLPTAAEVMSDPGYQFGLSQGQQALDRRASAAGGRLSGASLKGAMRYATDYASTGYGAAYARGQDRLARLQSLAGLGQSATSSTAAAGSNSANAISDLIARQGDAAGAAQLAQGSIWGNAVNQIGAAVGSAGKKYAGGSDYQSWSNSPFNNSDNYG